MISTRMTLAPVTPVPAKTLATGGRLGTAADSAGGTTAILTAIAVTRQKFSKGG